MVKNSTGHRRREIPGWNEYVKEAHSNSANAAREWREAGLPRTGPLYENKVTRHKQYKYALRKTKRNEKSILNEKLAANLASNNGNQFWKDIRKVAGKTKTAPTSINGINGNIDICEMWKDHYEGILNCMQPRQYLVDKAKFDASAIVTAAEIHDCILSINITDSPGPDGLSTEHLKFGPASLCEKLAKCLTSFFVHGCIPHSIMDVHIVPVVKDYRGKLSNADNYRPIAIASCISKLIECCILNRIEEKISVTENQFGFKKGLGTDSCIFVLKEMIDKFRSCNTNSFLVFLDASKAFDKVRHDLIYMKLEKAGIPVYIIRLIKFWYAAQSMFIRWNGHVSERFRCSNGVKQGGILSPFLFN